MSIDYGQANFDVARALVNELVAWGLRHAVVCPGSRSTPLAVAMTAQRGLTIRVLVDERSAAYFALGMARQLGEPVAILSTSGTAAANFLPAVVEASLSRIPLIVLTADRPPELRDWGAAQTIDQIRLFGSHANWFVDLPAPDGDPALVHHARATAARAVQTALRSPAGPVHINAPFREPLLPADVGEQLQPAALTSLEPADTNCITARSLPASDAELRAISADVAGVPRGIVICGPGESLGLAAAVSELSAVTGYPVLADPLSGVRFGRHDRSSVVDCYDTFLRDRCSSFSLPIPDGAMFWSSPVRREIRRTLPPT
jgi:2-succinyl-5-enolpyruvyl-6-hydroxy-3-cyclohexene-1-carboxylate synthase